MAVLGTIGVVAVAWLLLRASVPHPRPTAETAATRTVVVAPAAVTASSAAAKKAAPPAKHASSRSASTTTATKPAAKPAPDPAPKPTAKPTLKLASNPATPKAPLGMKRLLTGSKQLVVATGAKLGSTHGTLRIYDLTGGAWKRVFSAPCRFGTNGLVDGTKRKEGSRTTPTGIWWPGSFVWGWHGSAPSGTHMPYRQTTAKVWWSDERNSTYNTWVVSSKRVSGEHLVDVRIQYEYAWSTGYNAKPNKVVRGRGTAIFLHIFDPPSYHHGLSAGCVTVSRTNMIRVLRTLDPKLKPSFAVGTEAKGKPTSITSY